MKVFEIIILHNGVSGVPGDRNIWAARTKPEQPGPFVSATRRTWRLTLSITSCTAEPISFNGTHGLRIATSLWTDDERSERWVGKIKTKFPARFKNEKIRTYYTEMNHTNSRCHGSTTVSQFSKYTSLAGRPKTEIIDALYKIIRVQCP